jgi:hypothetical protein
MQGSPAGWSLTLFQKRISMERSNAPWSVHPHPGYLRDQRWYAKKHPRELAAVMRNLERYLNLLTLAPDPRALQAGFIHPEKHGMIALDQRGGDGHLQPTRLYCFAQVRTQRVHLLGLGDKSGQPADLARLAPIAQALNS